MLPLPLLIGLSCSPRAQVSSGGRERPRVGGVGAVVCCDVEPLGDGVDGPGNHPSEPFQRAGAPARRRGAGGRAGVQRVVCLINPFSTSVPF